MSSVSDIRSLRDGKREKDSRIIWMDLEMTGLDLEVDHILEIGCLVTDKYLNYLDEGINIVVHQSDKTLDKMNEWCKVHHGKSGLTEASRASKITVRLAEEQVLSYVSGLTSRGMCPLAGNTVHEDKRFLLKYMPNLVSHLHYRIIDVSTVKELCRRWYPEEYEKQPGKQFFHRSLEDIKESIVELKYYWSTIFKEPL